MRAKKLNLDPETLAVDSFETAKTPHAERGTVLAQALPCSHAASCVCASGPYYCNAGGWTAYSCDYTFNAYCTGQPETQQMCVD